MPPIIQVENLGLRLSGSDVLRDVSLVVREGEYVSIIGPNGAGKTSLIKCLAGIHRHWSGTLRLADRPFRDYGAKERARLLGYVPQAEGRGTPSTVEEFVTMGRYPHLSPFTTLRREDREAVHAALARTGLLPLARRRMNTLSGGERQMAFIAAALAQGARILLLDEPAAFLDYRHQAEVSATLLDACRSDGITIVAVHHDINTAAACSDRICALKAGVVAFEGTPAQALDAGVLAGIYGTAFRFVGGDPLPIALPGGAP